MVVLFRDSSMLQPCVLHAEFVSDKLCVVRYSLRGDTFLCHFRLNSVSQTTHFPRGFG